MLPSGTATYTGAGIAAAGLPVALAVTAFSPKLTMLLISTGLAPEMCAPDAPNCVSASAMAIAIITGIVTTVGSAIVTWGRARAERRHQAELAAAKAPQ